MKNLLTMLAFAMLLAACAGDGDDDSGGGGGGPTLPAGTLQITTTSLANGMNGVAYGENVYATGGTGVGYTWSISGGSLNAGLTLDFRDVPLSWGAFTATGAIDQSLGGGKLSEVSGIVASASQPGVFCVHDDSGAGPSFYAIDAAGNYLQEYTITAGAQDWEDIAIGPGPGGVDYLYLADVGDNSVSRTNYRIYRVTEPTVPGTPQAPINAAHDEFWFTYPGGSQNCETMLVDWTTGTPYLVEKVGTGAPQVHKFPMPLNTAWTSGSPVTLIQVTAAGTFDATLTGGDSSRDGRRVILRGYSSAREYAVPAGGTFDNLFNQAGSAVTVPGGQQYEAICYSDDGTKLYTATEIAGQASAPIQVADAVADNGYTTISGTPSTAGGAAFTLKVMDSAGNSATRQFTLTVN
ncbi:MAG: hypothetical protein H6839_14005 [Planctomycetes bacterium]|nr:hypothetical protein [Planctomycetota bacterium]